MQKHLLFLLLVCFSVHANAQDGKLIPRETFFQSAQYSDIRLNEAGTQVYFRKDEKPNSVFRMPVGKPDAEIEIEFPGLLRDWEMVSERLFAIVRVNEQQVPGCLDQQGNWHPLGNSEGLVSARFLRKSGQKLAYQCEFEDDERSGIYIVAQEGTSWKRTIPQSELNGYRVWLDGDLNLAAAMGQNERGGNDFFYRSPNEEWKRFLSQDWSMDMLTGGFSRIMQVSEDGEWIYYASNAETDKCQVYKYSTATHKTVALAQDDRVDLLPYAFSADRNGNITSVVGLYAKTIRKVLDPEWKSSFDWLERNLEGDLSFAEAVDGDRKWLVRAMTGRPVRYYLFDREKQTLQHLLTDFPELEKHEMAVRTAWEVKTEDGTRLPVHVYLPDGTDPDGDGIPNQPLPTILYVHGGPWAGVFHWNHPFHWRNFQLLANRGYAVINCEFRGSTGLGKDFVEKSARKWGTDMMADKVAIANWAAERNIADPNRVGIWGWSYGGYATLAGLAFSPETYACGVAMYAPTDLLAFGRTPFADNDLWHNYVGDPHDPSDTLRMMAESPLNFAESMDDPVLLTTGSQDRRVPQSQMDSMADRLAGAGKEPVYFYYPEEGHDYQEPENWMAFWAIAEQFLAKHLGGHAQSPLPDLDQGNYKVVYGQDFIEKIRVAATN